MPTDFRRLILILSSFKSCMGVAPEAGWKLQCPKLRNKGHSLQSKPTMKPLVLQFCDTMLKSARFWNMMDHVYTVNYLRRCSVDRARSSRRHVCAPVVRCWEADSRIQYVVAPACHFATLSGLLFYPARQWRALLLRISGISI